MQSQTQRLFSLKWKTIITLSIALVVCQVGVLSYVYSGMTVQAHQQQIEDTLGNQSVLTELSSATRERLQQLVPSIASLAGLDELTQPFDPLQVQRRFDNRWYTISGDVGLVSASFYGIGGELISEWDVPADPRYHLMIDQLVASTLSSEEPMSTLLCLDECLMYVAVPLLDVERKTFITLVSTPLDQLIIDFGRATRSDIAVLLDSKRNPRCCWRKSVSLSTDRDLAESLLGAMTKRGMSEDDLLDGVVVEHLGRKYRASIANMNDLHNSATEVLIADVTDQLGAVQRSVRLLLVVMIAVVLLLCVIVAGMLWRPMSQIRKLADALPLLSDREYGKFRQIIDFKPHSLNLQNEIDILDQASIAVSEKLESMEYELTRRSNALRYRAEELVVERDFIQGLFDTAQVIILTLDKDQHVTRVNKFGLNLLGASNERVVGKTFSELLMPSNDTDAIRDQLQRLSAMTNERYRHESIIRNPQSGRRDVVWLHAGVQGEGDRVLSIGLDVTEQLQAEARLSWIADHDQLTSLYNRARFTHELEREIAMAGPSDTITVLLFGVDSFKDINGTMGHQTGDQWLRHMGQILQETTYKAGRTAEWVARIGGDEFAVMVPNVTDEIAIRYVGSVAERLQDRSAQQNNLPVTASIGLASYPVHGVTVRDLMSHADLARDVAKASGGGQCHVYSDDELSEELAQRRVYWKQRISKALVSDGFQLVYQPIVRLADYSVSHCEVLLRLKGDNGELVSPAEFIDIAESSNQINAIERWVIKTAVAKLIELQEQGNSCGLSVNLSGRTLNDPQMLATIYEAVNSGLEDPTRLIFELTETAAVANLQKASEVITQVQQLGCRFAFDDFGVGFSSFEYLKTLPADYVKLDASFVKRVHLVKDDQTLVLSMVKLIQDLGKKVIAEGVEDRECYEWLKDHGVEYIQGYYFGRPHTRVNLAIDQDKI